MVVFNGRYNDSDIIIHSYEPEVAYNNAGIKGTQMYDHIQCLIGLAFATYEASSH